MIYRFADPVLRRTFEIRTRAGAAGRGLELWRMHETAGENLDRLLGTPSGKRSFGQRLDMFPVKRTVLAALLAEILRLADLAGRTEDEVH